MPIVAGWIHVQSPFWWTPFVGLFWGYYPVCAALPCMTIQNRNFATFICHRFVTHLASKLGAQTMEEESDECIFEYTSEPTLALNFHPLPENQLQAITSRTPWSWALLADFGWKTVFFCHRRYHQYGIHPKCQVITIPKSSPFWWDFSTIPKWYNGIGLPILSMIKADCFMVETPQQNMYQFNEA